MGQCISGSTVEEPHTRTPAAQGPAQENERLKKLRPIGIEVDDDRARKEAAARVAEELTPPPTSNSRSIPPTPATAGRSKSAGELPPPAHKQDEDQLDEVELDSLREKPPPPAATAAPLAVHAPPNTAPEPDNTRPSSQEGSREVPSAASSPSAPSLHSSTNMHFELGDISELQSQVVVGKGASGNVFKALHTPTGTTVCMKQVPISLKPSDSETVLQSLRELYQSTHPNVTAFHGAFYDGHSIMIVCEYMSLKSVKDILKRLGPMSEAAVGFCCGHVLDALTYLHRQRHIIHRDIKPSNVLLNRHGVFKISDFGMSKELSHTLSAGQTWVGTSCYMSPERVSGLDYSFSADVWSVGILIYECMVGASPYAAKGTFELLDAIVDGAPPALPMNRNFSADSCDFVDKALHKDHQHRPDAGILVSHRFVERYRSFDCNDWICTIPID